MNFSNSTEDAFVNEVMTRLVAEHNRPIETFEYLRERIRTAHLTERGITVDQMNEIFHGADADDISGVSEGLQSQFPLLNAIGLSPYVDVEDVDKSGPVEIDDEDEDVDDEDDDSDDEDEDEDATEDEED